MIAYIYLVIQILPSLNYDVKDQKYTLLDKIFNIIDSKKARNVLSRMV